VKTHLQELEEIDFVKGRLKEVLSSEGCIKKALDLFGDGAAVSCSFGRDSTVVLHQAIQIEPRIKVIFCNTGIEHRETLELKDLLSKEWDLNLIETNPVKDFWECIREYGLPLSRTEKGSSGKPKCCWYLKELPFLQACKEHGIRANLTGLKIVDSRYRKYTILQRGQYYFRKTRGEIWQFHPIAFWSNEDILRYYKERSLRVPIKSGCLPCTAYQGWRKHLEVEHPRMFEIITELYSREGRGRVNNVC